MDENDGGWNRFSDPDFAFEFDHPTFGPSGAIVTLDRVRHSHGEAIHLQTEDAREIYFELDR